MILQYSNFPQQTFSQSFAKMFVALKYFLSLDLIGSKYNFEIPIIINRLNKPNKKCKNYFDNVFTRTLFVLIIVELTKLSGESIPIFTISYYRQND